MKNNYSAKISNATKWSTITSILRKLVTPITSIVLARLLTPEAFGIVATINMVISFADVFTDAGFQKYLIQHEFADIKSLYRAANIAFWTNLLLSIATWMLIFLFSTPLVNLVGSPGYEIQLIVAALAIPMTSFSSIQQALFKRDFDFKGMFVPQMISSFVPLVVTVPLAIITHNCWALIIGSLMSKLVEAIMFTIKSTWKPKLYYDFTIFFAMFSFSAWTLLESISIWLTTNVDIFIIGRQMSNYYLGLYKTSITTVTQITNLLVTIIVPVLFSALSRFQNDDKEFADILYSFQRKSSVLLIPLSIGMFVYRNTITLILLGPQWSEAALFLGLNGLMQGITVIFAYFGSEVYRAKGEPRVSFLVQIIYILSIVPTIAYASQRSFTELCIVRTALMVWFVIIHLLVLKIKYQLEIGKMLKCILQPCIASGIMGIMHKNIRRD